MILNQDLQKAYGLFENMPIAYAIFRIDNNDVDPYLSFYYANSSFLQLYGIEISDLLKTPVSTCLPAKQNDLYFEVATTGVKKCFFNFNRNIKKYLKVYCYQPIFGYCACLIDDVTEQFNLQQLLKIRAQSDSLTGLYNKETTHEYVIKYLNENKTKNATHAMIVLDLDNFKEVNDYFGHIYGDALLLEISNRIKSLFRSTDIVGRIGGDEFMIFMKQIKNFDIVHRKINDLCFLINENYNYFNIDLAITTSVGIAIYPNAGLDFDTLYNNADVALYKAKEKGKNQYYIYNENETGVDYNDIVFYNSKLRKNKLADKIKRILGSSDSPFINLKTAIRVLCNNYGFKQGYICEKGTPLNQYSLVSRYPELSSEEIAYPEQSTYLYDCIRRFDYCYLTEKSAAEIIHHSFSDKYKTLYYYAIHYEECYYGFIGFNSPEKCLSIETTELGELTVITKMIANYYLKIKQKNMTVLA
ncbi:MAG: GGDEF domain-containing protein [Bacilli bacterium]|nr:GGDEF domain-containing protein [Bacilli bacterium]MDD4076836.1 GGDEF domain-containing protein [Bacilli bacterium]MDD4389084.1 GGDEF domain-containing protein [Bacilli bacterium]